MRAVPWTGRPGRVDEGIMEYLLNIVDELRIAILNIEVLHLRSGGSDHLSMPRAERARDIALEQGGSA
jgi:hypothetical protein